MTSLLPAGLRILCVTLLSVGLALNLIKFYWIDSLFVLATLLGLIKLNQDSSASFRTKFGLIKNPFVLFFGLFFLSGIMGYIQYSPLQEREWVEISNFRWLWGFFAFYFLGWKSRGVLKSTQSLFIPLTAVLGYILYLHFRETAGHLFTPELRLQGLYENPNHFALALAVVWGFIAGCLFIQDQNKKWLWLPLAAIVIVTVALISSYSRTSWIGIIAATLVALIYSKSKKGALVSLAFVGAFSLAVYFNYFGIQDRILSSFNFSPEADQFSRLTVWKVAWQIFIEHPFFGVGFEQNVRMYPEYYAKLGYPAEEIVGHAHNQFLEVLSGAGIFGLVGYLGVFTAGFVFFHRRFMTSTQIYKKQIALGALLVIVALFGGSFTDAPFRLQEVRNYILMLLGFAFGFLNTSPDSSPHEK